jgi:hypothetical protein
MPWRGPEAPGEFPTLGYLVADWIEAHCVIPDGDHAGEPYLLTDEMLRFLLWHYRVNPDAKLDKQHKVWRGVFTYFRGSQLTRPQKWGKGPFASSIVCAECAPDGPVLFDGWDADGEPVGRPWATPWWQITAVSEDQTDNVWRSLKPMIELGALAAEIPDTGLSRINLPGGGIIEPVTSSASSRLGQRITGSVQDETHDWREANKGRKLADTQRRNLAGTGGRFLSTTNAWDPAENSVAQTTAEGGEPGVYHDDVEPGAGSVRNAQHRRRMIKKVYGDSWWVDPDRIDGEIVALLPRDPAQAERFFLNRKRAGEAAAFDIDAFKARADTSTRVADGAMITIGVDGARFGDALGILATEVITGHQWPLGIWERKESAPKDYEHPFDEIDGRMLSAFETFDVRLLYIDPQYIDYLVHLWQGRWGDKVVHKWFTNRNKPIAHAVRSYTEAINAGDQSHSGDETFTRHIGNSKKQKLPIFDDKRVQMHTLTKDRPGAYIDAAMAGTLSWEARQDAIAGGALEVEPTRPFDPDDYRIETL